MEPQTHAVDGAHPGDLAICHFGDHPEVVGGQHDREIGFGVELSISHRICACTVTSSAVVGSSAISSSGSSALLTRRAASGDVILTCPCATSRARGKSEAVTGRPVTLDGPAD
ncbi:hypothetical protein MWU83_24410 [Mycolicibacterium sp. F2034L]|nr:hypothetical protein [Mycolicibacterium sp. F2034L]